MRTILPRQRTKRVQSGVQWSSRSSRGGTRGNSVRASRVSSTIPISISSEAKRRRSSGFAAQPKSKGCRRLLVILSSRRGERRPLKPSGRDRFDVEVFRDGLLCFLMVPTRRGPDLTRSIVDSDPESVFVEWCNAGRKTSSQRPPVAPVTCAKDSVELFGTAPSGSDNVRASRIHNPSGRTFRAPFQANFVSFQHARSLRDQKKFQIKGTSPRICRGCLYTII